MGLKGLELIKLAERQVDAKSEELIKEFYDHFEVYKKLHPEDKDRKDEVFQGWIIQKIAGLQLSIIEISERINQFIKKYEQEKENT